MSMEKAIKLAIEGGYTMWSDLHLKHRTPENLEKIAQIELKNTDRFLLDPTFWQCLGKALGWEEKSGIFKEPGHFELSEWWSNWHSFIDHLAIGKDADTFFKELLSGNN